MVKVDLNVDMGESFGFWLMGNDLVLLDIVISVNVVCGWYVGDVDMMVMMMVLVCDNGVNIGVYSGFVDF